MKSLVQQTAAQQSKQMANEYLKFLEHDYVPKNFDAFEALPKDERSLCVLSGGLDSTILTYLTQLRAGSKQVEAITFDYGQRQDREIARARDFCFSAGIEHHRIDLRSFGEACKDSSANLNPDREMPTIHEVLADPQPATYVPNRNMVLMAIAAAVAESREISRIHVGLQMHDTYGYYDTTCEFVDSINGTLSMNRKNRIQVYAPFGKLSKRDELELLFGIDKNEHRIRNILLKTLTCYDPTDEGSCGVCPSCSERLKAFQDIGFKDPLPYRNR